MRITRFVNRIKLNRVCLGLVKLAEPAQESAAPLQGQLANIGKIQKITIANET
jgi:hypothetical protein